MWNAETLVDELVIDVGAPVSRVAFHPEGSEVAVVTAVGEGPAIRPGLVEVFAIDLDDLVDEARTQVVRPLTPVECARFPAIQSCQLIVDDLSHFAGPPAG